MLKALVLDAFSRAGLETIQSLGRHGVIVHASSPSDCQAFGSRYVAKRLEQPTSASAGALLPWLRQINAQHGYSLIVPSTEYSLAPLADLQEDDPLRGPIQIAPRGSIYVALDKWSTLELARSCGVPTPPSRLHDSQSDFSPPESFPVVLKATRSLIPIEDRVQLMQSCLVLNHADWKQSLLSLLPLTPVIEQQYLKGHGVGVELLYQNGQMIWHFCHRRLHEGAGGGGLGSGSSYRCSMTTTPELLGYATTMLDRIRWHGVAMVEFLVTPDGRYFLMEINPRLWGSLALAIDAGVDFPVGLFLMATDQRIPRRTTYRVPYYTRDIVPDARWIVECLRLQPVTGFQEVMRLGRVIVGRESWDHFDWKDLGVTATILRELLVGAFHSMSNRLGQQFRLRSIRRLHRKNLARLLSEHQGHRHVLFLCHGNICRSPFAELVARREIPDWKFFSAGFHTLSGRLSPESVQAVARSFEVDLSGLRSKRVSRQAVDAADIVMLMDASNLSSFTRQFPHAIDKVLLLGMFASPPGEIPDPYGANVPQIVRIFAKIDRGIAGLAEVFGV